MEASKMCPLVPWIKLAAHKIYLKQLAILNWVSWCRTSLHRINTSIRKPVSSAREMGPVLENVLHWYAFYHKTKSEMVYTWSFCISYLFTFYSMVHSSLAHSLKIICLWTIMEDDWAFMLEKGYKNWQANVWQEKLSIADEEGLLHRTAIFSRHYINKMWR